MSTRCNIVVKNHYGEQVSKQDECVTIYHHYDGYPTGVGRMLIEFIQEKYLDKKANPYWHFEKFVNTILKGVPYHETGKEEELIDNGFEWTSEIHGDIDYLYVIAERDEDVLLTCYSNVFKKDANGEYYREDRLVFSDTIQNLYKITDEEFEKFNY